MSKHILLTNDDGIHSAGLEVLYQAIKGLGEISIIAPTNNCSAVSHSFSMHRPLRAYPLSPNRVALDGMPTDCVMFAVLGYLERKPDLVIAGINFGPNLGDDVTYSGTVAAALEATMLKVPAFAVSLDIPYHTDDTCKHQHNFETAAKFARKLAEKILEKKLPEGCFLNVNVPDVPWEEIAGAEFTKLGKRIYKDRVIKRLDPLGKPYYWLGGEDPGWVPEPGTDFDALERKCISMTPLRFELTDYEALANFSTWDFFNDSQENKKKN